MGIMVLQIAMAWAQTSPFSYENPQPLHEVRAVWLTTISGLDWPKTKAKDAKSIQKQKEELREILNDLHSVHINTVIFQTRIRGSVIYPSAYEPWDECLTGKAGADPGYDPLQFCINECHARGMECHAWVVCVPLGKNQAAYGDASVSKKNPDLCRMVNNEMYMLPGNPKTADYIGNICKEIATKYDVDGISLDYIRYPESPNRLNDDDLAKDVKNISNWRKNNITRIVRAVHDKVKAIKPWVKLSSSPIGKYRSLKANPANGWNCFEYSQDPVSWLKTGIQDILFPMMYFKGNNFYPFLYDWAENAGKRPVCPGLGIYFLDPKYGDWEINDVRAEMFAVRRQKMGGVALYRSDFLTNNYGGLYDCCFEEQFLYPALQPRMIWEADTVAPSKPEELHFTAGKMHWKASTDYAPSTVVIPTSPHNYVTYNIYGSRQYPVDTKDVSNLIFSRVMNTSFRIEGLTSSKKYFAVTAVDRFGNESEAAQGMYEGGDLTRNLDVRSLINNTYQTAIPVMPVINYDDVAASDTVKNNYDFDTDFDFSGFDLSNAHMTKQSKTDKERSRERIVLVPVGEKKKKVDEKPKKLSITARNNLRIKERREQKEREERERKARERAILMGNEQ